MFSRMRCGIWLFTAAACTLLRFADATGQEPHPGQAPYDRVCQICHGAGGKGHAAPALVPFSMAVDELLIRVREGGGEMPPFSESRVSDDEVKQMAAYLKSLDSARERRA